MLTVKPATVFVAEWLAADPCPAAADPGWLTGPRATVVAAIIAVSGAVFAYLGVTKTTRTTRQENRRAEKVAVLTDAWAAVFKLARALERVNKPTDPTVRAERIAAMTAGPMGTSEMNTPLRLASCLSMASALRRPRSPNSTPNCSYCGKTYAPIPRRLSMRPRRHKLMKRLRRQSRKPLGACRN